MLAYKDNLAGNKSAYIITLYLTSVRKLHQWLESNRICPDITRGIKEAKKPKGFGKDTLSQEQIREALNSMEKQSLEGLRGDYALFNLLDIKDSIKVVGLDDSRLTVHSLKHTAITSQFREELASWRLRLWPHILTIKLP
jgi:hypothetical protein